MENDLPNGQCDPIVDSVGLVCVIFSGHHSPSDCMPQLPGQKASLAACYQPPTQPINPYLPVNI